MADLRKAVEIDRRFVFELEADSASGCRWEVVSDGGLEWDTWFDNEEQPRKPESVGKKQRFCLRAHSPGCFEMVLRNNSDPSRKFVAEVISHPPCEDLYGHVAEGFTGCVPLESDDPSWKVAFDDGIESWIGTKDDAPAVFFKGGAPGEYELLLSSSDDNRVLNLRVEPVITKLTIETTAGTKIVHEERSNPTTGFVWTIVEDGGLICNDYYKSNPNPKFLCGVGGTHFFEMTADAPGTYVLRAMNARPWEPNYGGTLEITVVAKPKKR